MLSTVFVDIFQGLVALAASGVILLGCIYGIGWLDQKLNRADDSALARGLADALVLAFVFLVLAVAYKVGVSI